MKEIEKEIKTLDGETMKVGDAIVRRLVEMALYDRDKAKRFATMKFIWEKIDGKDRPTMNLPRYENYQTDPVRKMELMQLIGLKADEETKQAAEEEIKYGHQQAAKRSKRPPIQSDI